MNSMQFSHEWCIQAVAEHERMAKRIAELEADLRAIPRCPTCNSPDPKLHPAMQYEGEVQVCKHLWHEIGR